MVDLIDDNFGRLQELILHFQIPVCTRKDFLETCGQFGYASSNSSPALVLTFFALCAGYVCRIVSVAVASLEVDSLSALLQLRS